MADVSRSHLAGSNWQLLESSLRLKGTVPTAAYLGYRVPGTWVISCEVIVPMNKSKTDYPAIDAALREMWNFDGTVASDWNWLDGLLDMTQDDWREVGAEQWSSAEEKKREK
jgi:hypothetical protein